MRVPVLSKATVFTFETGENENKGIKLEFDTSYGINGNGLTKGKLTEKYGTDSLESKIDEYYDLDDDEPDFTVSETPEKKEEELKETKEKLITITDEIKNKTAENISLEKRIAELQNKLSFE